MKADSLSTTITQLLHGSEESATTESFLKLLRRSPWLCRWLWHEFAESAETRQRFRAYLHAKEPAAPVPVGPRLLSWLAGEQDGYLVEVAELQKQFRARISLQIYGGLSRAAVEALIRRYQAGNRDYGVFFLLYMWRKFRAGKYDGAGRLAQASQAFWLAAAAEEAPVCGKQLVRAQEYFSQRENSNLTRADYGFSDWWKISVLLYMLNQPKPRYRTGEFRRHLEGQRLHVDSKDIRAFCKQHGIARDSRVGRPRKSSS